MIEGKATRRTVAVMLSTFLPSTKSALVQLGRQYKIQVNTLLHAMRKFMKNDPRLYFMFRAVMGTELNGFSVVKYGTSMQLALHGIRTTLFHYIYMVDLTAFDVFLYLTEVVHIKATLREKKLDTWSTYAVGTPIGIADYLVSRAWKKLLHMPGMGSSIKYMQPYMLFNKEKLIYEILHQCDDGYTPTAQMGDL